MRARACYHVIVMIGRIDISLSAAAPSRALPPIAVVQGSAATFAVSGVGDAVLRGLALQSVLVSLTTPDGLATTATAQRRGGEWLATFPPSHFSTPGICAGGLTVAVVGADELGRSRQWVVGVADCEILSAAAVPAAGESWQIVRLQTGAAENPHDGDLVNVGGRWQLFAGGEWVAFATAADAADAAAYALVSPVEAAGEFALVDRAVNEVAITAAAARLALPAAGEKARDLIVRLDLTGAADAPAITLAGATFETADGAFPAFAAGGVYLISMTETRAGVFALASRRLVEVA